MEEQLEVVGWHAAPVAAHRDRVWTAWLHGRVAAVRDADRLLLVVPMDDLPPTAVALALHLHHLGHWDEVGAAAPGGRSAA